MVQLKWWIKDNKVEVITVTGIVIALIIVLITLIYQMNKFEIECRASGGHVESTFLYMQYIPISNGKITTMTMVPVYEYKCVK